MLSRARDVMPPWTLLVGVRRSEEVANVAMAVGIGVGFWETRARFMWRWMGAERTERVREGFGRVGSGTGIVGKWGCNRMGFCFWGPRRNENINVRNYCQE